MTSSQPIALVTGASGLIGRWLISSLTRRGQYVVALVRRAPERTLELAEFVDQHGGDSGRLWVVEAALDEPELGLPPELDLEAVRDVFHCAGLYAWRLEESQARRVNVDATLNVARWAGRRSNLRRLVYVGGYRMSRPPPYLGHGYPLAEPTRRRLYRELGAYEASKAEANLALRAYAEASGLPLTVVNPCTVSGDSRSGETSQLTGLGETVRKLWEGSLPVNAGGPSTFVPVVPVDYLAEFMATVPENPTTVGQDLNVLDPDGPTLPELVRQMARHLGVRAPKRSLPVGVVRALPEVVSGVVPETLSFISDDRYDTGSADAHAESASLHRPDPELALTRWLDYLVATRFGEDSEASAGRISTVAGSQTYCAGDPIQADNVLLHGIPWDGENWRDVTAVLGGSSARPDLPGLGRSSPCPGERLQWLETLLRERSHPVWLVGHSLGAGLALEYATRHPERVAGLVLVSPFFLQGRPPWPLRFAPLGGLLLRNPRPDQLQSRLFDTGESPGPAVTSAAAQLGRSGVPQRMARALAHASHHDVRGELKEQLASLEIPSLVIHGSGDPLLAPHLGPTTIVEGAGHDPQVSHPREVAGAIENWRESIAVRGELAAATPCTEAP